MAEKTTHTPGPWIYGVRDDGSIWLSLGDHKTGPHYQGDLCASEEDARLIASAPDLLAALKDCLAYLENDVPLPNYADAEKRAARAAIAKATEQS